MASRTLESVLEASARNDSSAREQLGRKPGRAKFSLLRAHGAAIVDAKRHTKAGFRGQSFAAAVWHCDFHVGPERLRGAGGADAGILRGGDERLWARARLS